MRKHSKRTLSLALALMLCLGLVPTALAAEKGYTVTQVVPCKYDVVRNFSDGVAEVQMYTGEYDIGTPLSDEGYINTAGEEVVPVGKYKYVGNFNQGVAEVRLSNGEYGYIDTTGKEVDPPPKSFAEKLGEKYDRVENSSEGLRPVSKDNKWGYVDDAGKEVIPCTYDQVEPFSEGLAAVKLSGKGWGFIDKTGKEVVPSNTYDEVHDCSEGLALVHISGQGWGCIDVTGNEVVPLGKYGSASDFSEGLAAVSRDGKWGFISVSGSAPTTPAAPAIPTAYASTQTVTVDGKSVEFQCYALKDANGNLTNYIKLRDLAMLLSGTPAQFQVGWDGSVSITTKTAYTPNGSELKTPFSGDRTYQEATAATKVNGQTAQLAAFTLNDDNGGGYTYYKLRDLGKALGFNVGWSAEKGIYLATDKPYDPAG